MPFNTAGQILTDQQLFSLPETPEPIDPGLASEIPAAFRLENPVASFIVNEGRSGLPPDPNFDAFQRAKGTLLEQADPTRLIDVRNEEDFQITLRNYTREQEDRKTILAGGLSGTVTTFAAGFFDPFILLPVGGQISKATTLGRSLLKGGAVTARAGAIGATASEMALQATQDTRTGGETLLQITTGTFLSGLLGAGAVALSRGRAGGFFPLTKQERARAEADIESDLDLGAVGGGMSDEIPIPERAHGPDGDPSRAGSDPLESNTALILKSTFGADRVAQALTRSPMLRMLLSPYDELKDMALQLFESPFRMEGNKFGLTAAEGGAVETTVKVTSARNLSEAVRGTWTDFVNMRRRIAGEEQLKGQAGRRHMLKFAIKDLTRRRSEEAMTFLEYKRHAGYIKMNRLPDPDAQPGLASVVDSPIPEINTTIKRWEDLIFDPFLARAIEADMLPTSITDDFARAYLPRLYNIEMLKQNKAPGSDVSFTQQLESWLAAKHARIDADDLTSRLLTPDERASLARQIRDHILNGPAGRILYEPVPVRGIGPMKERVLDIDQFHIARFLEQDIETLGRSYTRTMEYDVELGLKFKDFAPKDGVEGRLTAKLAGLRDDLKKKYEDPLKDGPKKARVADDIEKRIEDMRALIQIMRGRHIVGPSPNSYGGRVMKGAREFNVLTKGGRFALLSTPDVGGLVLRHGIMRAYARPLKALITNLEQVKLSMAESKRAGVAGEMVLDSRMSNLENVGDDFGRQSKFERGLHGLTRNFFMINGLTPWNSMLKQWTGLVSQDRIARAILARRAGNIKRGEMEYLSFLNIGDNMTGRIARQIDEFNKLDDGLMIPNTTEWTDLAAREAYQNALSKDIDSIIVTPSVADIPIFASNEFGKTVFQFKSFAFASVQRTMIAGLQQRDAAAFQGMMMMWAMGAAVYYLSNKAANTEVADDVKTWVAEGIDRSGLLGIFSDYINILDRLNSGPRSILGAEPASRYAARNTLGSLAGPTMGTLGNVSSSVSSVAGELLGIADFNRSDLKALRRLTPYQNLFYFQAIANKIEESMADSLGLPRQRRRSR